jgi:hypothetical protein
MAQQEDHGRPPADSQRQEDRCDLVPESDNKLVPLSTAKSNVDGEYTTSVPGREAAVRFDSRLKAISKSNMDISTTTRYPDSTPPPPPTPPTLVRASPRLSWPVCTTDPPSTQMLTPRQGGNPDEQVGTSSMLGRSPYSLETPNRPTKNQEPVQTADTTREGTRQILAGWLTTIAEYVGTQKLKKYDDAGFSRGRAMEYPRFPDEESRNPDLSHITRLWTEQMPSRDPSPKPTHSAVRRRDPDPETPIVSRGLADIKSSAHDQELSSTLDMNRSLRYYGVESSRHMGRWQRREEPEEDYESDATYEERKQKQRKERETRDDDKVEQRIAVDGKRIDEDEHKAVAGGSTGNYMAYSEDQGMMMMKQAYSEDEGRDVMKQVKQPRRPTTRRGIVRIDPAGNENGSHGNLKPPTEPLFTVPYPPTSEYVHLQPLEDDVYDKLLLGGARVALVGAGGIG